MIAWKWARRFKSRRTRGKGSGGLVAHEGRVVDSRDLAQFGLSFSFFSFIFLVYFLFLI